MTTSRPELVATGLGRLHVRQAGSGAPAVLWHSLFVDSTSWGGLVDALAAHRRVIVVDGPAHGRSEHVDHDFTLDDCATTATEVLDELDIAEPVDWVGNAWGGHVGIVLAAARPERVRTLTTIGTPVQPLGRVERLTRILPLVQLYRVVGPVRPLVAAVSDALLGSQAVAAEPERTAQVMAAFRNAHRPSMLHAMRSVMLDRGDLADRLPRIAAPTLMLAAADDTMDWSPADAEAAARTMPDGRAATLRGSGHVAPLLLDQEAVERAVVAFWNSVT